MKWQCLCTNSHLHSAVRLLLGLMLAGWGAAGLPRMHSTCTKALFISRPVTPCNTMNPKWRFGFSILMDIGWSISQTNVVSPLRARNVSWINLVFLWVSKPVLSLINMPWLNFHLTGLFDFSVSVYAKQDRGDVYLIGLGTGNPLHTSCGGWEDLSVIGIAQWLTLLLRRSSKITAQLFSSSR